MSAAHTAGVCPELSQLGAPPAIARTQRIAEQAARDAVSQWRRSTRHPADTTAR